jgi:hypothetical protein
MADEKNPNINGVECSFASIECGIDGLEIPILEINYANEQDMPGVMANANEEIGWTAGTVKSSGDMTILNRTWKVLLDKLGDRFSRATFPMKIVYAELASPQDIMTDVLPAVSIISPGRSHAASPDALPVKIQLRIKGQILWDGKRAL